ncbi:MAG: hypothetical protein V2A58_11305 [Planctomycetota bacterium]
MDGDQQTGVQLKSCNVRQARFIFTYEQHAWGTERSLTVTDTRTGQLLGQRDPFWNYGIPASAAARKRRLLKIAREIITEALAAGRIAT